MQTSVGRKIAMVLVLVVGALYFLFNRDPEAGDGLTMIDLGAAVVAEEPEQVVVAADGTRALTEPVETAEKTKEPAVMVTGTVFDTEHRPVAGLLIERHHAYLANASARTDEQGRFVLPLDEAHGELVPIDERWMMLGGSRHLLEEMLDGYVLVVAPRAVWKGVVVDPAGKPIADALLHVVAPGDSLVPFGIVAPPFDHESQRGWSNSSGEFQLGPTPRVSGSRIEASRSGYANTATALPDDPATFVKLVLEPNG